MALLSDSEKDALYIEQMVFHVVGPGHNEPVLLEEISPPVYTDFFLERVRSASGGNIFLFKTQSSTEECLRRIEADPSRFAKESEFLAREFHRAHVKRSSDGAFFVFRLAANGSNFFCLIKYDNEDVVRYLIQSSNGRKQAQLQRFQETFVKKPEAMQKVALVRLDNGRGGSISVRDRTNQSHISDYFARFLDVRRQQSSDDLTKKLVDVCRSTLRTHRSLLPEAIKRSAVSHVYEMLRHIGEFDPHDESQFIALFGLPENKSEILSTFRRELKKAGMDEEVFKVSGTQIPVIKKRILETAEGVKITYDDNSQGTIKQDNTADGGLKITITTSRLVQDDVDT